MSDAQQDARSDSFGEETELRRDLGPVSATAVIVGSIIGSGIFAGPAIVAGYTGSAGWNLLVWVICAFMAFCGAVTFAELGGIMPRSGGLYVFLKEAYGRLWGFLFGWTSLLVIRPCDLAAISIVFATYLGYFVTQFSPYPDWAMRFVASIVLIILAYINYLGVRFGGLVQNLSSFLKVGGLLLMVALAFGITPDTSNFQPVWPSDTTLTIGFLSMISLGMVASFGAYDGWDGFDLRGRGDQKSETLGAPVHHTGSRHHHRRLPAREQRLPPGAVQHGRRPERTRRFRDDAIAHRSGRCGFSSQRPP